MEVAHPSRRRRPHVLIVEDDRILRFQIARAVREMGWTASELEDARELFKRLDVLERETEADVLITDLHMPHVDGIEVLKALSRRGSQLRVIVVTAFADDQTREKVRALGARMVISKPFDLDDLCTALLFISGDRRRSS